MRRFVFTLVLIATTIALPTIVAAQQTKVEIFCISGSATAGGALIFKIVPRGSACSATATFSHTQAYDAAAGGGIPTTDAEVAAAVAAGLGAVAPGAGYTAAAAGPNCIKVTGPAAFDICVDGTKINVDGGAGYSENGLTVQGSSKSKVPSVSFWGLILLTSLMIGSVLFLRRRSRFVR